MRLVSLTPADAADIDSALQRSQAARTEPDLVESLATSWATAVTGPASACSGGRTVAAGSFIHKTPIVDIGTTPNPELGDLLVVTGYLRTGVVHRGRAVIFQAKGPRTMLPAHQQALYEDWPPFVIVSPRIPAAQWDVGPEGLTAPPSRRGCAYLRVAQGSVPMRAEVGSSRPSKSLGECVRSMLRCRYSRAFARVAPDSTGTNSWDQLVTYLLQRSGDRLLAAWFGPLPVGLPRPRRRRPTSAAVAAGARAGVSAARSRSAPPPSGPGATRAIGGLSGTARIDETPTEHGRHLHVVYLLVNADDAEA